MSFCPTLRTLECGDFAVGVHGRLAAHLRRVPFEEGLEVALVQAGDAAGLGAGHILVGQKIAEGG